MAGSSDVGRKALVIFLILLAIGMLAFIFTNGMGSFNQSKTTAEEGMESAEGCFRQLYTVDSLAYDGSSLSFKFNHLDYSDAEDIKSVTVVADTNTKITFTPLMHGMSKMINVENVNIGSNFSIYAGNCASYRVFCDLEKLSCK